MSQKQILHSKISRKKNRTMGAVGKTKSHKCFLVTIVLFSDVEKFLHKVLPTKKKNDALPEVDKK